MELSNYWKINREVIFTYCLSSLEALKMLNIGSLAFIQENTADIVNLSHNYDLIVSKLNYDDLLAYLQHLLEQDVTYESLCQATRLFYIIHNEYMSNGKHIVIDNKLFAARTLYAKLNFAILSRLNIALWKPAVELLYAAIKKVLAEEYDGDFRKLKEVLFFEAELEKIMKSEHAVKIWHEVYQ